jgi:hypothetical protein
MSFDIRLPIGLLFAAIGAIVGARGLLGDPALFKAEAGNLNIDLVWGGLMLAFGVLMLVLTALAKRGDLPPPPEA